MTTMTTSDRPNLNFSHLIPFARHCFCQHTAASILLCFSAICKVEPKASHHHSLLDRFLYLIPCTCAVPRASCGAHSPCQDGRRYRVAEGVPVSHHVSLRPLGKNFNLIIFFIFIFIFYFHLLIIHLTLSLAMFLWLVPLLERSRACAM